MKRSAIVLAFFITFSIFLSILLLSVMLEQGRVKNIDQSVLEVSSDLADLQRIQLISEAYGNNMACIAYKDKLQDFNKRIWDLGLRLEQYRSASEEILRNPYYIEQKKVFNENEFTYLALLKQIKNLCQSKQSIIVFFYRNGADCKKCDDQSFVLTDIKRQMGESVAIFSYDLDLNLTSVKLLAQFYNATEQPCIIINDQTYCGMRDRQFVLDGLCQTSNGSTCA